MCCSSSVLKYFIVWLGMFPEGRDEVGYFLLRTQIQDGELYTKLFRNWALPIKKKLKCLVSKVLKCTLGFRFAVTNSRKKKVFLCSTSGQSLCFVSFTVIINMKLYNEILTKQYFTVKRSAFFLLTHLFLHSD